jgi:microcystin-dependent protein
MPLGQAGVYWPFKSLLEGAGITLQEDANSITVTATGGTGGGSGDMLKSEYAPSGKTGEVDHAILADTATNCSHSALADSVPWNGITGLPASFPSDWSVITNKPNLFPPLPHAPQHLPNGNDPIGLAGMTAAGLLAQLSGSATDFVGGDNACHAIQNFVPTGICMPYVGTVAPSGFLLCDGSEVDRTIYAALFAICGIAFGQGNGTTTFNLPDLRSRIPLGAGAGPLLTARSVGQKGGEENHLLSVAELASHGHTASVSDPTHSHTVPYVQNAGYGNASSGVGEPGNRTVPSGYSATGIQVSIGANGGNAGHNNMQPYTVLTYIVKT